jgi:HrpA-like RNA helicase
MIGITQPRRVAAISTCKRVSEELNFKCGDIVSYHVRYSNNISKNTKIKFMTDGKFKN